MDIIGSRKKALYDTTKLPVFTPLDDFQPVLSSKPLPDLIYVDKPFAPKDLDSLLASLPYHGPGFYAKLPLSIACVLTS